MRSGSTPHSAARLRTRRRARQGALDIRQRMAFNGISRVLGSGQPVLQDEARDAVIAQPLCDIVALVIHPQLAVPAAGCDDYRGAGSGFPGWQVRRTGRAMDVGHDVVTARAHPHSFVSGFPLGARRAIRPEGNRLGLRCRGANRQEQNERQHVGFAEHNRLSTKSTGVYCRNADSALAAVACMGRSQLEVGSELGSDWRQKPAARPPALPCGAKLAGHFGEALAEVAGLLLLLVADSGVGWAGGGFRAQRAEA